MNTQTFVESSLAGAKKPNKALNVWIMPVTERKARDQFMKHSLVEFVNKNTEKETKMDIGILYTLQNLELPK